MSSENKIVGWPTRKFRTIVIDPPWPMRKMRGTAFAGESPITYPTMSVETIRHLDISGIMDTECHLYLWATERFLPHAFKILEHWGLKYSFTMVWHKPGGPQPLGLPCFNAEFVLFGRKGRQPFLDTKKFPVCFSAPRREHSRKPDSFYDLVRRVSPAPRIDIFSREPRPGYEQYGNETDKFAP